ncbi:hypothetical protein [Vibrio aestuarianus]|uniref:hypothetical protein n=1 Tax=Vibrio aestuarianus TaxID=28171 RepID=UPI002386B5ED|nr:hypothetical protein [Vibrio aestuarianus]MDE1292480.1 hypothetical protein [Vibrio aestuarianus]
METISKKNVFNGINAKRNTKKSNSQRKAFDKEKIKRIFSDDFFYNEINARNGRYWVTILAATAGRDRTLLTNMI